jgi:anti-anti-sigma regulatory factor
MLKIQRTISGDETVFKLSGRVDAKNVAELKVLFGSEAKGRCLILDLQDLTLVDGEAVRFLERSESSGIKVVNCPLYVREWILSARKTVDLC